jgi:DNA-directed RNA polymerase subunit RPC12/RpoP
MSEYKCIVCDNTVLGVGSFCEEHRRCGDCGTRENLIHAHKGVYCHPCLDKRIEKQIEEFDGDTDYQDEVTCPYC